MKKNTFMQGALIATIAIVISKIIGVIYVIPFYPLIGERGGALYGYAYVIYSMFLNLSTAGIPFAISKITSEYNALQQYYIKARAYKIGRFIVSSMGIAGYIALTFFAKDIAYMFIGNIKGGNTIEDVTLVIRIVSTALLIVPGLSLSRGYLQGHKYIASSSISQVLEQFVRVVFLLVSSYMCLKLFHLSLTTTVGVAVFDATIASLVAYFYLLGKIHRHKKEFNMNAQETREEKGISTGFLFKKIIAYSIPFILISMVSSAYGFVDLSTINKTMVHLGYKMSDAEAVISIFTTWGSKLNSIIYSVSTGLIISLIPTITSSNVLKNTEDVNKKINSAIQILIFIVLPISIGLSMLATPVWTVFFGSTSKLGPMVFGFSIYTALVIAIFNTTISILHSLGASKWVLATLAVGLVSKILFNVPLMNAVNSIGIYPSYGVCTSTIISYLIALTLNLYVIKLKTNISYKDTFEKVFKTLIPTSAMIIVVLLLQLVIPLGTTSRLISMLECLIYGTVGIAVYLFISAKMKLVYQIFGNDIFKKILKKLKLKKVEEEIIESQVQL